MKTKSFINNTFFTNNAEETQGLGRDFANILKKGDIVCLYGGLGSGKTTFTQGLGDGLEIENRIISPTFVIIRSYSLKNGAFYHIDLYRAESEKDIESLGIEEILNNKENIVAIEWAEKLKSYCPQKRIDVNFSYENSDKRKIMFRSSNQ